jgi:hypothetical protein
LKKREISSDVHKRFRKSIQIFIVLMSTLFLTDGYRATSKVSELNPHINSAAVDPMDKLKRFERVVDNELLKQDPVIKQGGELQSIRES